MLCVKAVVQLITQNRTNLRALIRISRVVRQHDRLCAIEIDEEHIAYLKAAKERIKINNAAFSVIGSGNFQLIAGKGEGHLLADKGVAAFGVFEYPALQLREDEQRPNEKSEENVAHKA